MFCTKCGSEVSDNMAFCPKCGNKMTESNVPKRTRPVSTKSPSKAVGRNDSTKKLIYLGIGIIVILLIFILILAVKGKNKNNSGSDSSISTESNSSSKKNNSKLEEISGNWKNTGKVAGGSYADFYEYPSYFKIESRGIMALSSFEKVDLETMEAKGEGVIFNVGIKNIDIYEENGNTYYEFKAPMKNTRALGMEEIGMRVYFDNDDADRRFTLDYFVPDDGYWQTRARYKLIDSVQDDRDSYKVK